MGWKNPLGKSGKSIKATIKQKLKQAMLTARHKLRSRRRVLNRPMKNQPLSHNEWCSLRYDHAGTVLSSTSQFSSGSRLGYYLNNIIRPYYNQSTGDVLPSGLDTYSGKFARFKVYGAKITFEFHPNMTGKDLTLLMCMNNSTNGLDISSKSELDLSGYQNVWAYSLPTDRKFKFSKYISIRQAEALTRQQYDADIQYYQGIPNMSSAAIAASSPQKQLTFWIAMLNNDDATAVGVNYDVNIEYKTNFTSRARLAQSKTSV